MRNSSPVLSDLLTGSALLFFLLTSCGSEEDIFVDAQKIEAKNALIGRDCEQVCETQTTCEDVVDCRPVQKCSWNLKWYSSWWGSFPYYSYSCRMEQECNTVTKCTDSQVCNEVCEPMAYPPEHTIGLLNALNYWSSDEIANNLGIGLGLANAITQSRIDNGGVFYGLTEVSVAGFNPDAHLQNPMVESAKDLHSILAPQISYNNKIEFFIDGPAQLNAILDLINGAQKYIHLTTMLFLEDVQKNFIAEAIRDAASRGVIVRVLFDHDNTSFASSSVNASGIGSGTNVVSGSGVADIIKSGCIAGVVCDVRSTSQETEYWDRYTVPGYDHWYDFESWAFDSTGERTKLKNAGVPEYMLRMQDYIQDSTESALNVFNHQKFMIVDGKKMMFASSNFGPSYQYDTAFGDAMWKFHDGISVVEGPAIKHAQRVFAQQWFVNARGDIFDFEGPFYLETDESLISAGGSIPVALLLSFPGDPKHLNMRYLTEMLGNSTSDVYMTNPYPTDGDYWNALNALTPERASRTHLVTSIGYTDGPTVGATIRCRGKNAARNGFKVYDFYNGTRYVHLKLTVDTGKSMVHYGSNNFNMRSKRHDLELNFLARDPNLAQRAQEILQYDISQSGPPKPAGYYYDDPTWVDECIAERASNWGT